eukprot:CAMPEP_0197702228 /NCGR_PEP_ID=MMETSP1338-20131121/124250_1 /TAXON_ID=43686 ORGANISM="Pelagodinium beii, Strain RCC1491" /NCGR_SAMPLE_ID=MMETSP1338 /ASSEMBLY_ACC=CAM_ASM_000754 /LENGTH=171 /DNA_ID=CAMNT_0043286033 /DNA_START=7 /DNA_END=518 /DNA_ORIENTATION=-
MKQAVETQCGRLESSSVVLQRERAALEAASRLPKPEVLKEAPIHQDRRPLSNTSRGPAESQELEILRAEVAKLSAQSAAYAMQIEAGSCVEDGPDGLQQIMLRCQVLQSEKATLQQELSHVKQDFLKLQNECFEPPELEELQVLCGTLESKKRDLEQQLKLAALPEGSEAL